MLSFLDEVNRLRPHDEYHCHFQERLLCHNNSNNNMPTMTCWRFLVMKRRLKQRRLNCLKRDLPMKKSFDWPQISSRVASSANMALTATAAQSSCKRPVQVPTLSWSSCSRSFSGLCWVY